MREEQPTKEKTEFLEEHGNEDVLLDENDTFLSAFERNKRNPAKTLFMLYKGNYLRIVLTFMLLALRDVVVVVAPIITARIIDVATVQKKGSITEIFC